MRPWVLLRSVRPALVRGARIRALRAVDPGVVRQSGTAKEFREDYDTLVGGLRGVPVPLPGTDYTKAQAAKRRLLRKIESYIRRRGPQRGRGSRGSRGRTAAGALLLYS